MADTPVPRSLSEILGEMFETFVSGTGISSIKAGDPAASILEAAAQSDLRSSEDLFALLESYDLNFARGTALDQHAADEGLTRYPEARASGPVTITDTSFSKISSKIYQGTAAPIVGSDSINVPDASEFPSPAGEVYIGRGTNNYEGPVQYSNVLPPGVGMGFSGGNYYTLELATGTTQFHNVGESVILAQGGDRTVEAGALVQTAQGNSGTATQYRTLYSATIPDGETSVSGVDVVASVAGPASNIQAKTIKSFVTPPFNGASVTNPAPFSNGRAVEMNEALRERIKAKRRSRSKGTPVAIRTEALGVSSPDENKRTLSANLSTSSFGPSVLFIDDGTGYEEKSSGAAIESFTDLALGGENRFEVENRPIAKASVTSGSVSPFTLASGQVLSVSVGGVVTTHTFDSDEFRSIENATAYEVVSSINSDWSLGWVARTADGGTRVVLSAKVDSNEWIQVQDDTSPNDNANQYLVFPTTRVDTMLLYKNDKLLTKDGALASVSTTPMANWSVAFGTSVTLDLEVDGTPLANLVGGTYTFTAQDFIDAGTGYTSLGRNSLEAWASVFNYRISGITASVTNGVITITSNRGLSSRASLVITGGTLVTSIGMFEIASSYGASSDYKLDRNTGELLLATPLSANDKLVAGTTNTRAFVQTPAFSTFNVAGADGKLWFVVDGNATIIEHGVSAANPLTFSSTAETWGVRQRVAGTNGTFTNVAVGDWLIWWDAASPVEVLNSQYRVAAVDSTNAAWIEFDLPTAVAPAAYTLLDSGLSVVRSTEAPRLVTLPIANNYTANGVADLFDVPGIDAETYRTTALRVRTSSFDPDGDIALVAANLQAQSLELEVSDAQSNLASHQASVESGNSDVGTPDWHYVDIVSASGAGDPTVYWTDSFLPTPDYDSMLVGARPIPDGLTTSTSRYGHTNGAVSSLADIVPNAGDWDLTVRELPDFYLQADRYWFASPFKLSYQDSLAVLVDADTDQKRFVIPAARTLTTVGTTYASTNTFKDGDNGGLTLAKGFGYTGQNPFSFDDFAVYMAARTKTHNQNDDFSSLNGGGAYSVAYNTPVNNQNDLNRAVLWRYYRLGPEGNYAKIRYAAPTAEDQSVSVTTETGADEFAYVKINLASGNRCTGFTLSDSYPVATVAPSTSSGMTKVYYLLAFNVSSLSRTGGTTVHFTIDMPTGVIHSGLDLTGATPYYFVSNTGSLATQDVYLNGETLSGGTYKIVTSAIAGANFGPVANAGVLYLAGSVTASLAGASPAIAQGDFLRVSSDSGLPSTFEDVTVRIQNDVTTNPYWIEGVIENFGGGNTTTFTHSVVGSASAFKIFKNPANTASAIVTAVNALVAADPSTPVRPTLLGTGATKVDRDSAEDAAASDTWYALTDGINYVKSTTEAATSVDDYDLTFKNSITASLATNSDWANEVVKIVPRTTQNVVDWLNRYTVTGLSSVAEVKASSGGRKVQIASLTSGSAGSVQVQGGTANTATASVVGSSRVTDDTNRLVVTIDSLNSAGFQADSWVSIDNAEILPKNVFDNLTVLNSITNDTATTSELTLSAATDVYTITEPASTSVVVNVEAQGAFVAITSTNLGDGLSLTAVNEGDWVRIVAPASPLYIGGTVESIALGNIGIFRVIRKYEDAGKGTFWIENSSFQAQPTAECDIHFYTDDSVMPGDYLSISNTAWDGAASNRGVYEVVNVGSTFTNPQKLRVNGTLSTVGAPKPALGSSYQQIQVLEGRPARLIKRVIGISPAADTDYAEVKLSTSAVSKRVGEVAGSVLTALDKLGFGTGLAIGVDGYKYNTGLLQEVNRVMYGYAGNETTYPGVVAAGSIVNIQGPLVKRVQVTVALRLKTGVAREEVKSRAQSAIAAIINRAGLGEAISLSDITTAAGKVGGVTSATMVSPTATAGADVISVQPYEKPLVLNVDQDVIIVFVGD
jgi:uncharacterized phage protein gp47/JayE